MSLTKCKFCDNAISERANVCAHCGAPVPPPGSSSYFKIDKRRVVCPECGKEVSIIAAICVNCGYPMRAERIAPKTFADSLVDEGKQFYFKRKYTKAWKNLKKPQSIIVEKLILC